jgi:hypothetical protein
LALISVSDHEGDFSVVRPSYPIARSRDNRHSEIVSDKPNSRDLSDKVAIQERRKFFVGQVMLRLKEEAFSWLEPLCRRLHRAMLAGS